MDFLTPRWEGEQGGGRLSYKKDGGAGQKFKKFKRYQHPVLWAWLEIISPLRGTNLKTTHLISSVIFFFGSTP